MLDVRPASPTPNTQHPLPGCGGRDRKSTRLNSSHQIISYAVFCLKKKNPTGQWQPGGFVGQDRFASTGGWVICTDHSAAVVAPYHHDVAVFTVPSVRSTC